MGFENGFVVMYGNGSGVMEAAVCVCVFKHRWWWELRRCNENAHGNECIWLLRAVAQVTHCSRALHLRGTVQIRVC